MKKVLSLRTPFIKSSPCYAAPFSIANIEEINPVWCTNCFGYLYVANNSEGNEALRYSVGLEGRVLQTYGVTTPYDRFPGLRINCIEKELITEYFKLDIVSFFRFLIDQEKSCLMFVNVKYIDEYESEENYLHPLFLYGYDTDKRVFYGKDYIKRIYSTIEIDEIALEKAVLNAKTEYLYHEDYLHGILIYQKGSYDLPSQKVDDEELIMATVHSLEWMFEQKLIDGIVKRPGDKHIGGFEGYKIVREHLNLELKTFPEKYFHKPFTGMIEHKKILELGIKYCFEKKVISEKSFEMFLEIKDTYQKILSLYLYAYTKGDKRKLENIIQIFDNVTELEKSTYSKILMEIIQTN